MPELDKIVFDEEYRKKMKAEFNRIGKSLYRVALPKLASDILENILDQT